MKAIATALKSGSLNRFVSVQRIWRRTNFRDGQRDNSEAILLDTNAKVARFVAAAFIAAAGIEVLPLAATALVEHAIKLIRTEQPFLRDAGVTRLYYLSYFDSARKKALELGAVEALSNLLQEKGTSPACQKRQLVVLESLSCLDGFRDHFNCSALTTLLYSLESIQLDGRCDGDMMVATKYSIARELYKKFCKPA